jgi:DNA invertase Pin-like site-specific DNA recombinase
MAQPFAHDPPGDGPGYVRDCVLYLRKSKGKAGISRQRRDGYALAERLRWRIIDEFVDADSTAHAKVGEAPPPRPDYIRMLGVLRADERPVPLGVIGWHADRLHRSTDVESFIVVCAAHKHPVETVRSGSYELWTATGRKRIRQDAVDAAYEVDHLTERVDSDREEKVRLGRWMGGPVPFGWKLQRLSLEDDDKYLVVDPPAADAIRWGCKRVLLGDSQASIATEWTSRGLTRPRGGKLEGEDVRRILIRPRNAGLMESKGEVVETELPGGVAEWPPIVAPATWRAVKLLLDGPDRVKGNSTSPKWLGSGFFRCGTPGCTDTVKTSMSSGWRSKGGKGRAVVAYRCRSGEKGHIVRDAAKVDEFVAYTVQKRLQKPDFVRMLRQLPAPDLEAMEAELVVLREELGSWRALAAKGEVSAVAFAPAEKNLLQRIAALKADMVAAVRSPVLRELVDLDDIAAAWENRDLAWKRAVLRNLVVVTINKPSRRGRPAHWREGEPYFDYGAIDIEWLPLGGAGSSPPVVGAP